MRFQPRFTGMYRPWHLVLLLSACALALTFFNPDPTATQVASAQEVSEATPEVERLEVDTITAIDPSDEDPPDDPPPGEESRDTIPSLAGPTITVVGGDPGALTRVELQKGICPSDLSRESTLQQLIDACAMSPHGGVTFELIDATGPHTAVTDASGFARFSDVLFRDDGTVQLTESVPTEYGDPVVWCHDQRAGETVRQADDFGSVILDSEASHLGVIPCAFFNFPDASDTSEATGTVRVSKYTCPAGYDPTDLDDYLMSEQCREEIAPVEFTVNSGEGWRTTQAAEGTAPLNAEFTLVPIGPVSILESVPAGYGEPLVFCSDTPADGAGNYEPVAVSGGNAVSWELRADAEIPLTCLFFNIPEGDSGTGDLNTLTVTTFDCPEGTARDSGLPDLGTTCDSMPGVDLSATYGGTSSALTTDATGNAVWTDIPAGPWSVHEAAPTGYGQPKVFCGPIHTTEAPEIAVTDGTFGGTLIGSGEHMVCTVFNLPEEVEEDTTSVAVVKHGCPDGYPADATEEQLFADCTEHPAATFFLTDFEGYDEFRDAPGTETDNVALFEGVTYGPVELGEWVPDDTTVAVLCSDEFPDGENPIPWQRMEIYNVDYVGWDIQPDTHVVCHWFNTGSGEEPESSVTVNKYVCPSWVNVETDILLDVCASGGDGIPFEFVDGNGRHHAAVSDGKIAWYGVFIAPEGELQIIETIPEGYGDPIVVCDGVRMESTNGFVVPVPGGDEPFKIVCDWFNIALEDANLRVIKHTCEPGYDLHASGADPLVDCPELTNGVDFHLTGPEGDIWTTTGDAGDGTIQFGGLDPGAYVLTESVPEGTENSFVLDCYGNELGAVRPYPLSRGDTLRLQVHSGETIECHWFNVPESEEGTITIVKHICTTEKFESEVDCQVYEDGATFDLHLRTSAGWEFVATATTNDHGEAAFTDLGSSVYWIDEHDGDWCHIASPSLIDDPIGNALVGGDNVVVDVYNCEPDWTTTTVPKKYPNTGVQPVDGGPDAPVTLPAGALAGVLLTRRRFAACAVAFAATGLAASSRAFAQGDDQVIEPLNGTPVVDGDGMPLCLAATPGAENNGGCARGLVPFTLRIDAIGVDAPVEILETVAGTMQQPSDDEHVAWYKETARLGEPGNMLMAGHLNWWDDPEAVFYNLGTLAAGDEVVALAEDGTVFTYVVEWVRNESNLEPPKPEVVGPTDFKAVTLITCGGEWDSSISEYDERTVVRAALVSVTQT